MKQKVKRVVVFFLRFLGVILISILNPWGGHALSDEMRMVFSFIGVLFAILSGFFISSLWDRFTKIRALLSSESGSLENIYEFLGLVDKKLADESAKLIDKYIMKALESKFSEYQEKLRPEYFAFYSLLSKIKGKGGDVPYTRILNILDHFTRTRKEIIARMKDRIGLYQWIALLLLSSLLITLWLYIQPPGIFGVIIGSIFIFAVLVVLIVIHDLDRLVWSGRKVATEVYDMDIEVYERVYDVIGLPRYYPEELFDKKAIPEGVKLVRVGIPQKNNKRKIKIFRVK
ncbi:MAG: hypothetical protein QXR60_01535 [Candidatus Nanoarchaeia archaeon]